MSKLVQVPQVWMVAVPDVDAVHWKTCSGAPPVAPAQVPLSALAPLVVPGNVPPSGGITWGLPQVPVGGVVAVDEVMVVDEELDVVAAELVLVVVDEVVVEEEVADVLVVTVVVVEVDGAGGTTVRRKLPLAPL